MTRPATRVVALLLLLCLGACREEFEHTPCGEGAYLMELPDMSGVHVYCRTNDKVAHGDYRYEDYQGNLLMRGRFYLGRPDGEWTWWFDGGLMVKQEGAFQDGLAQGLWKGYDSNGTLRWEHTFHAGIGCGTWRDYDDIGDLETESIYLSCDGTTGYEPPEGAVMAPEFTDDIWNGATCPGNAFLANDPVDVTLRWCAVGSGKKEGHWARFFPEAVTEDGGLVPQILGQYSDGLATGTWTHFNQLGEVIAQGEYANDVMTGPWGYWRAGGMPLQSGSYVDGERHGKWQGFHGNGLVEWLGAYQAGLKSGLWQTFSPTGLLTLEAEWKDDLLDGSHTSYHNSGAKFEVGDHSAGQRQGTWLGYWDNSIRYYEGEYVNDFRHGLWTWYDRNGDPSTSGEYVWQNPIGDWTIWIEDLATGLIMVGVGPYDYGIRHGIWTFTWEEAGTLESDILYIDNLREGPWVSYWPNGVVRIEGYFLTGVGEYTWHYYHENGQMMAEHTLHEGKRYGDGTTWHENGQMKSQGTYNGDLKTGTWTYWDEDGNVIKTEEFDAWGYPK